MSGRRFIGAAVALAIAGVGAVSTVGIAAAQGEHGANQGRSDTAAARAQQLSVAAGSACEAKSSPVSGTRTVTGNAVRILPTGARTTGAGEVKTPPAALAGRKYVVLNGGQTVHYLPTGAPCRGSN